MTTALGALKVVELGEYVSAAYCTKLLGDLGAEVIKIEPPAGDPIRRLGPFPPQVDPASPDALDWSGTQLYLDANKTSLVADVHAAAGRDAVDAVVGSADAFVTNLGPARLRELGLDAAATRARHPDLVYVSISPFGSWGPYSGWTAHGLNAEATGGGCTLGEPDRVPLAHPWGQVHIQGGAHAAAAALAALLRPRTGEWIDIGEADIWAYHVSGGAVNTWVFHGRARQRSGRRQPNPYPAGAFFCQDGLVNELAIRGSEWKRFLQVLGSGSIPDWARDPRYQDRRRNSIEYSAELDERQGPWLMAHTREEIFQIARANRLPFAPVYRINEVVRNEHLNTRDFFVDLQLPDGTTAAAPGAPYILSATPCSLRRPAPRMRDRLPAPPAPPVPVPGQAARTPPAMLPLAGIRVLDLTAVIAGPLASRMLCDFGAETIKIESRAHPDALRTSENNVDGNPEHDSQFHFMNRNKRGITLNIRSARGRQLFKRLADTADIVLENFSTRMMPERGLDYRTLSRGNPGLIMVSMPGAGDTGPLRDMVSYAPSINAVSGLDSLAGYPDEDPVTIGGAYCDWNSAVHAVVATLAALHSRASTGRGQYVNVAQWEAATASIGPAVLQYTLGGQVPSTMGNRHIAFAPHGIFPARGPDSWVALACANEAEWVALKQAMGSPSWADDDRYATAALRRENASALESQLAAWTCQLDRDALVQLLQSRGVAATPVLDLGERWIDPHFQARSGFVDAAHPTMGSLILGGVPWKFDSTPLAADGRGPLLGEHNAEVFGKLLDLTDAEISELEESHVIY